MSKRDRGSVNEGIGSGNNVSSMTQAATEQWGDDWNIEEDIQGRVKIIKQSDGINFADLFLMSRTGVELARDVKIDEYWAFFEGVFAVIKQSQWVIADMIVGGEARFNLSYKTIAERTGLKIETIRQYAYVSRNASIRIDELSFSHHHAVINLSPAQQKKWLQRAVENEWSVADLRRQIKGDTLPTTVPILADKANRNTMNRVWRHVQRGTLDQIKDGDLDMIEAWFKELRGRRND